MLISFVAQQGCKLEVSVSQAVVSKEQLRSSSASLLKFHLVVNATRSRKRA